MVDPKPPYNQTFLSKTEITERLRAKADPVALNRVLSAYELALNVHQFQKRNDGTPYFWHPTRVAKILLVELSIEDDEILAAALLHDVLEDSDILTPEVISYNFGPRVAHIVEVLTKEIGVRDGPLRQEINRKYIDRLMASEVECRIIKLADRVDNLRCIAFNLKRNPFRYVSETLENYVPMAERGDSLHLDYLLREIRREQNRFFG